MKILEEAWARRASAGANQQELTTCAKKCRQEEEGEYCRRENRHPHKERQATTHSPLVLVNQSEVGNC
jgi:hypothetical protein